MMMFSIFDCWDVCMSTSGFWKSTYIINSIVGLIQKLCIKEMNGSFSHRIFGTNEQMKWIESREQWYNGNNTIEMKPKRISIFFHFTLNRLWIRLLYIQKITLKKMHWIDHDYKLIMIFINTRSIDYKIYFISLIILKWRSFCIFSKIEF